MRMTQRTPDLRGLVSQAVKLVGEALWRLEELTQPEQDARAVRQERLTSPPVLVPRCLAAVAESPLEIRTHASPPERSTQPELFVQPELLVQREPPRLTSAEWVPPLRRAFPILTSMPIAKVPARTASVPNLLSAVLVP